MVFMGMPMPTAALPILASWVVLSNHTHTQASPDSALRVADLDRLARASGVQAVVITDHNTVQAVLDPAFKATGSVTFIEGQEWGTTRARKFWGHVGIIGLQGDIEVDPLADLETMFSEARRRGALAVINHPFNWALFWRGEDVPAGAGGIEVWNQSWNTFAMDNSRSLIWWDTALRTGRRLVAVGGSDVHGLRIFGGDPVVPTPIDTPVNLVWAEDESPRAIMEGIHAGRVVIARDSKGPRIDLLARQGERVAMIGDEVPPAPGTTVSASVSGGKGLVVSFHTKAGKRFEKPILKDQEVVEWILDGAEDVDFVRAELREPGIWPEPPMVALTNPIYIRN